MAYPWPSVTPRKASSKREILDEGPRSDERRVQKGVRSSWLEADKKAYESGIPGVSTSLSQTYESAAALYASSATDPLKVFEEHAQGQSKAPFSMDVLISDPDLFLRLPEYAASLDLPRMALASHEDHEKALKALNFKHISSLDMETKPEAKVNQDETVKEDMERLIVEGIKKTKKGAD